VVDEPEGGLVAEPRAPVVPEGAEPIAPPADPGAPVAPVGPVAPVAPLVVESAGVGLFAIDPAAPFDGFVEALESAEGVAAADSSVFLAQPARRTLDAASMAPAATNGFIEGLTMSLSNLGQLPAWQFWGPPTANLRVGSPVFCRR
jgi:hypothetical protein